MFALDDDDDDEVFELSLLELDSDEGPVAVLVPIPLPRCNNAKPARAVADCDPCGNRFMDDMAFIC